MLLHGKTCSSPDAAGFITSVCSPESRAHDDDDVAVNERRTHDASSITYKQQKHARVVVEVVTARRLIVRDFRQKNSLAGGDSC